MTRLELKVKQAKARAAAFNALIEQIITLHDKASTLDALHPSNDTGKDFWEFAEVAAKAEKSITEIIRRWVEEESSIEREVWVYEYFNCPGIEQESNQEMQVTTG